MHIDTTSRRDLPEHPSTRRYYFAGVQHTPATRAVAHASWNGTTARYPLNVLDYLPLLRAALINLDRWITEGVEPPPSRHPRIRTPRRSSAEEVLAAFARLPDFKPPDPQRLPFVRTVDMGWRRGDGHRPLSSKGGCLLSGPRLGGGWRR